MEKFLAKTVKYLLDKHGHNLSEVAVLMPNHRSCVYFREALKDASPETIWAPELTTLQDWVFSQSEYTLIEPLEQLVEMYEVYKRNGGEDTLDEFITMARIMLADFEEVDIQMANAKSFFNYLVQLKSMDVYVPGEGLSEYSLNYIGFWKMFRELYFGLRERLIEQKKAYGGMVFREVAERIESIEVDFKRIYFIGFSSLNKSSETIIRKLRERDIAEIIWDTDKYYTADEQQEAGSFFREYKQKFKVDAGWDNDFIATTEKHVNIIGVAKSIGQTKVVADILANKLQLDEAGERRTAVVVPDEKLLNPMLAAIPDNITALNISMGYPLQDSPVAELIKAIFSLHDNVERFRSARATQLRFYYRDVFDLLHHPYAAYLIPDKKTVTEFIELAQRRNRMLVGLEELGKSFQGSEFDKLFWYTDDISKYLDSLLALVDSLRIHFLKLSRSQRKDMTVDIELLFHVNSTLKNLQNIIDTNRMQFTLTSLRKLVLENIRAVRIPFDGEPVRGLQVMGMLETRSLDFKNVIIMSMNEGIVPSGRNDRTYVPYEMRREFLSTHQQKDADAAYLFYRLLQRAENVYLIYNTENDELGGGERSRFVLQLQHELKRANSKAVITDYVYSVDPPPAIPDDEITIVKDEALLGPLVRNLTEYGISPSAINSYINCTLQYYLRYIARLREQEDIEESIEASTLGSGVHYVLEHLYKDVIGKELPLELIEKVSKQKEEIERLLKESFAKRFDEESLKRGKNYLLYRVSLKLVTEFLKQEKKNVEMLNDSGSAMKLLMLEKEVMQPVMAGGHELKIRGKVDRVEESNGIVSIADYKTGTPGASSIKGDDVSLFATDPKYAKAMQLLTYAWLYWKEIGSPENIQLRSGIYWLRDISKGFDALKVDKSDVVNKSILQQFEEVLKSVLAELVSPDVPFTKTKDIDRCAHCEFVRICRRD